MNYGIRENIEKKRFKEEWGDNKHPINNLLNIPKPFRALIVGMPSSGKTTTLLRFICYQDPPFENIWLMHPQFVNYSVKHSHEEKNKGIMIKPEEAPPIEEYKGIDFMGFLTYIPTQNFFENYAGKRNLLIIDDIELRNFCWSRDRLIKLNKMLSYSSTHHNLSIIITSQDPSSQLPPIVMKFCNFFIIHKLRDAYQLVALSKGIGCSHACLKYLTSDEICKNIHDTICVDCSYNTPVKYRYNIEVALPADVEDMPKNRTARETKKIQAIKELVRRFINPSEEAPDEDEEEGP